MNRKKKTRTTLGAQERTNTLNVSLHWFPVLEFSKDGTEILVAVKQRHRCCCPLYPLGPLCGRLELLVMVKALSCFYCNITHVIILLNLFVNQCLFMITICESLELSFIFNAGAVNVRPWNYNTAKSSACRQLYWKLPKKTCFEAIDTCPKMATRVQLQFLLHHQLTYCWIASRTGWHPPGFDKLYPVHSSTWRRTSKKWRLELEQWYKMMFHSDTKSYTTILCIIMLYRLYFLKTIAGSRVA